MSSNRGTKPVKLFISITVSQSGVISQLEDDLILEFGPADHRVSLIPTGGSIHRVFLSFDRLIEVESLVKFRDLFTTIPSIKEKHSVKLIAGTVDNRRVATETMDVGHFKDGGLQTGSTTPSELQSVEAREFFLAMRKTYRAQLRSICLLRR